MNTFTLDVRSLSMATTLIATLFSIWIFTFGQSQKRYRGFNLLALANLSIGMGLFCFSLRGICPDFFTIIVANSLIISGLIFYFEGIRRFFGISDKFHPVSIVVFTINTGLFLFYTYQEPSVNKRIISICLTSSLISMLTAKDLFRNKKSYWKTPAQIMAFIFCTSSLFQLFRLLWTIGEPHIEFFMQAEVIHAFSWLFITTIVTGPAFGFVWMVSKELEFNLTELSHKDQLTKALNRRGLEYAVRHQFAENNQDQDDLTVLMFDIDHFKKVNDLYGHKVGDDVLAGFVSVINKGLRPYDIFARIGGEEFVIILSGVTLSQGFSLAERLRKSVELSVFKSDNNNVKITVSFGVFSSNSKSLTLEQMMRNADKALYYSKQHGRNRVSSFSQVEDAS